MTPTVGWAMRVSRAISPVPLAPISMTAALCDGCSQSRVMGTPTWLFRLPQVDQHAAVFTGLADVGAHDGAHHLLERGLAVAAGDTEDRDIEAIAARRRPLSCSALPAFGHHDLGQRQRLGPLHHRSHRAALGSRHHERRRIVPDAPQGNEQLAGLDAAGVGAHRVEAHVVHRRALPPAVSAIQARVAIVMHSRPAPERQGGRATSTSENGRRVCAGDLHGLVPLAGNEHDVAGPGQADRPLDGRGPVRHDLQPVQLADAPARMSAMICCGSSVRGLSSVTMTRSAPLTAAAPIGGALAPVPVAATAEHAPDLARAVLANGGERLARARPACGRNRRARPAGPAGPGDTFHAAGRRGAACPALQPPAPATSPGRAGLPAATSRFSALKRPQSGLCQPDAPPRQYAVRARVRLRRSASECRRSASLRRRPRGSRPQAGAAPAVAPPAPGQRHRRD